MDNDYKWIKVLTSFGWVNINTEYIESISRIVSGGAIKIVMMSGNIHLVSLKSQIKKIQEIIPTKI